MFVHGGWECRCLCGCRGIINSIQRKVKSTQVTEGGIAFDAIIRFCFYYLFHSGDYDQYVVTDKEKFLFLNYPSSAYITFHFYKLFNNNFEVLEFVKECKACEVF